MTSESGLVVVDKPGAMTSHDVVSRVRRLAGIRKVGHAGTLDPMATGVLVLGLNRATRLLGHLTRTDKRYDATIRLGVCTTSDDAEGEVVSSGPTDQLTRGGRPVRPCVVRRRDRPGAERGLGGQGRRPARLRPRRAGEEVELPARRVTIHAIDVVALDLPDVQVAVHCSSGTYVRAIARDLGAALGVGGHLTALRRTAVGPFTLADARTIEDLTEAFTMTPIADAARASFPAVDLDDSRSRRRPGGTPARPGSRHHHRAVRTGW